MPVGSAIASIGSSVIGGVLGSNAASAAGKEAQAAAQQGNQLISNQMQTNTGLLGPYDTIGQTEAGALEGLLGLGGNQAASKAAFNNWLGSTNYQFELGQGLQGVEYANAPAFSSSATAKALNNYAQGQAGNYLGQYESLLSTGAGQGIQAGSNLAGINTGATEQQSANLLAAAGVQGSAGLAGANAWTNALKGVNSGLSSFGNSTGLNLFGGGAGGGSSGGPVDLSQIGAGASQTPSSAPAGFTW